MTSLQKQRWADIQSDSEEEKRAPFNSDIQQHSSHVKGMDDTFSTTKHTHTEHIARNTQVMNNFVTDGTNTPTAYTTGTLRRVRVDGRENGTTSVHAWQQGKMASTAIYMRTHLSWCCHFTRRATSCQS